MSRAPLGKDTVETPFTKKSNTYYMQVLCIKGHEGILEEGVTYTVEQITSNGNYILEDVSIPEGYTSFSKDRFVPIQMVDDGWTEEMEEAYWAEQPPAEQNA